MLGYFDANSSCSIFLYPLYPSTLKYLLMKYLDPYDISFLKQDLLKFFWDVCWESTKDYGSWCHFCFQITWPAANFIEIRLGQEFFRFPPTLVRPRLNAEVSSKKCSSSVVVLTDQGSSRVIKLWWGVHNFWKFRVVVGSFSPDWWWFPIKEQKTEVLKFINFPVFEERWRGAKSVR